MSDTTKIQWADATFNPWIGCTKVSAGCKNCYAENTTRARVLRSQGHETWGKGAQRSRTSAATWANPKAWNFNAKAQSGKAAKRLRVFPSLCDWLDDEVPIEWLADFLKLIYETPNLDWLLLTKRPENFFDRIKRVVHYAWAAEWVDSKPPQNVWLGASVEDQANADGRIPELLKIPAKVRFLSAEPLLGPIDFLHAVPCGYYCDENVGHVDHSLSGIHWVIFGGESGPNARPCNIDWIRDGIRQCRAAGVAAFVKQLGQNPFCDNANMFDWPDDLPLRAVGTAVAECSPVFKDKKGGDMDEWPLDFRVREFPKAVKGDCV